MIRRTRKTSEWTFLVIPGAGRSVTQLKFAAGTLAVSAALVAALVGTTAAWLIANFADSERQIEHLASRLAEQERSAAEELAAADRTIRRLQGELNDLFVRAAQIETKLAELETLERQIRVLAGEGAAANDAGGASGTTRFGGEGGAYVSTDRLDSRLHGLSARIDEIRGSFQQLEDVLRKTPSIWPVRTRTVTSGFGVRLDPFTRKYAFHNGIDIDGAAGDPVFSTADGLVIEQGRNAVYGNFVVIEHTEDIKTVYMHLLDAAVKAGEPVERGQRIGRVGSTGRSTGSHLHYEVHVNDEPVDPKPFLSIKGREGRDGR